MDDKGIRYNGDGMLLGQLNVVNVGLLLGAAQDEYRGGSLREKSQHYKLPLLRRLTFNAHTGCFCYRKNAVRKTRRAGDACADPVVQNSCQCAEENSTVLTPLSVNGRSY